MDDSGNVRLPYKWIPPESFQDGIFSEKSDVVRHYLPVQGTIEQFSWYSILYTVGLWCDMLGSVHGWQDSVPCSWSHITSEDAGEWTEAWETIQRCLCCRSVSSCIIGSWLAGAVESVQLVCFWPYHFFGILLPWHASVTKAPLYTSLKLLSPGCNVPNQAYQSIYMSFPHWEWDVHRNHKAVAVKHGGLTRAHPVN